MRLCRGDLRILRARPRDFIFHGSIRLPFRPISSAAATYFVPGPLLAQIERCRDAMSALDASTLNPPADDDVGRGGSTSRTRKSLIEMKLVPINAGDEIPLKGIKYGSKTR